MNTTPISDRLQIGLFGKRNSGKSSFLNSIVSQQLAIVSDTPGTTTDPVGKAIEIRGLGPVYIYDTAGIDDTGELGQKRVQKTMDIIKKVNFGIIISTYSVFDNYEKDLIKKLQKENKKVLVVFNKMDIEKEDENIIDYLNENNISFVNVSCKTNENIDFAKEKIIKIGSSITIQKETIIGDLINQGDLVVLVVPIDLGAPKGRLILPQVQVIRDILDNDAVSIVVKERELEYLLKQKNINPQLVICDSQVVLKTVGDVPENIKMTTFSILFSRLKGDLAVFVKNVKKIDELQDKDKVLILEACTHHSLPDDIGRVKIPRWIREYTGKDIIFDTNAGPFVHKDVKDYKLLIHCGGCMINRQEMISRINQASLYDIPITNYGVTISYVHGVLKRALSPFPYELSLLED